MKFGIMGYGYVGKATHLGLLRNQKAAVYDITFDLSKEILLSADTVFVCIPTENANDVDKLIEEVKWIGNNNSNAIVIIRSTLPVGTCERIQKQISNKVIYIPEFLRERYWDTDCLKRPLVVGYNGTDLPDWLLDENISRCSTAEAELIKMFSNNFATMRIAFANVFYDLAQCVGADYNVVKDNFFKVQHNQTYMEVPGHDGTRGFGGKCLPKDLDFIIDSLEEYSIDQNWFKHIRELNERWKKEF